MNKLSEIKIKIYSIEILSEVKKRLTYKELSKELGLPAPVVSRYVKGHVLPNLERAETIIKWFEDKYFKKMLRDEIYVGRDGIIDVSFLTYDTILQRIIAEHALSYFKDTKVTKILTVETNGIPIAIQLGNVFGVDVIIARKERLFEKYYEERYSVIPPLVKSFYVPRSSLKKNDQILIVDDLIRTGNTIKALVSIVNKSGAKLAGIFTVIEVGSALSSLKNGLKIDVPAISILSK